MPVPRQLFLEQGNVAFFDDQSVLLVIDSRQTTLARIAYPDYRDWFDLIGAYRYWFFAAAWIVLTAFAVSLFRGLRRAA